MTGLRKWFRRLRTLLWTALTIVTVLAAVVVGVGKLLMPYSTQYKPQLEAWLSREFNQPVEVNSFTGEWKAFGPRISLEGLNLLGSTGGEGEIAIRRAALDIKPFNALLPGRPLYSFRIIGADLLLVRTADGRFELSGLGVSNRGNDSDKPSGLSNLARVGEVRLESSNFGYHDEVRNVQAQLVQVDGRLQLDGNELALEIRAGLSDSGRQRILGDIQATSLVILDDDNRPQKLDWHIQAGEVLASELARQLPPHDLSPQSGRLNAELWGNWSPGQPQRMEGVLDIRDVALNSTEGPIEVEHLNAGFNWRFHHKRQWRLDLADLEVEENGKSWISPRLSVERNMEGDMSAWVSADYLDLDFPLVVTQRIMKMFNARWPSNTPTRARGVVRDFDIVINSNKKLAAFIGTFENLKVDEWGRWPQLDEVNGHTRLVFGEGNAQITGQQVEVTWPRNFRAPLVVDIPRCDASIRWWDDKAWQVSIDSCQALNEHVDLGGQLRFASNAGKPFVDLNIQSSRLDLAVMDDYWPSSLMKPPVIDWLSRSLVKAESADGRFVLWGDLDDFPFPNNEGLLDARVSVDDAELAFHPDWPLARGVTAAARFRNQGMQVDGSIDAIQGVKVEQVQARIGDFKNPLLRVDYQGEVPLAGLAEFLQATPLLAQNPLDMTQFEFSGAGNINGQLRLPLGERPGDLTVAGSLSMEDGGFLENRSGVHLESMTGQLGYDREGLKAESIATEISGQPASLALLADWDAPEPFSAHLEGNFSIASLLEQGNLQSDPLLSQARGIAPWQLDLTVSAAEPEAQSEIWLRLQSDLLGVEVGLPEPLNKLPADSWPIDVRLPIQSVEPVLTARVPGQFTLTMETGSGLTGPRRANLHLGGESGSLPGPGQFDISGEAARVNLDAWMDLVVEQFRSRNYSNGLNFSGASLEAGEMLYLNRQFPSVQLDAQYDGRLLDAQVDSDDVAGTIRYTRTDEGVHSVTAQMQRLLLPEPLDEGMSLETDPAELPEMHLYVEHLRYMGLDLGETRIEAYPIANGLRFDSVESSSPEVHLQARGDWINDESGSRSDFDIVLTSESMGSLVSALNISSVLEGGQTMIRYDAWWPGSPAAFELAVLNGEMSFSVIGGRILNADPGAGRMLGLMSIGALPRRLAFDFSDVFQSGFSFDQAHGTIQLDSGVARTQDFVMESTAATLNVTGNSNLVNKEFDYQMSIKPGVSQALPVIGALTAGPAGAAAGLALQGLFKKSLGDAAEARYQITGTWDEPVVTRIEAPPGEPTSPQGPGDETKEPLNE